MPTVYTVLNDIVQQFLNFQESFFSFDLCVKVLDYIMLCVFLCVSVFCCMLYII